jgi:hypothetical protein
MPARLQSRSSSHGNPETGPTQFGFTLPFAAMIAGHYRLPSGVSISLVRSTSIAAKCSKAVSVVLDAMQVIEEIVFMMVGAEGFED